MIMHYSVNKIPVGVLGASGYAGRELCALVGAASALLARLRHGERAARRSASALGGREVTFAAPDDVDARRRGARVQRAARTARRCHGWSARARPARASSISRPTCGRDTAGAGTAGCRSLWPARARAATRAAIRGATLVANPGCYPTSILLALAPLLAARSHRARCDDRRQLRERRERRRQLAEARAAVRRGGRRLPRVRRRQHAPAPPRDARDARTRCGADADLVFTPHLLPVARGILSTITVPLAEPLDRSGSRSGARPTRDEPFIEIADGQPALRDVVHRNVVRIARHDARGHAARRRCS